MRKTCQAPDGVPIVYSTAGTANTGLVFIHGGMANRTFYDAQLAALSGRWRVIAVDLAGHGESGANRSTWGMREFGADVKAVADAEKLQRMVLFGNSLGGPVAIEAALLLAGRAIGVVGVDTFQDVGHPETAEYRAARDDFMRKRLESFRADYSGAMKALIKGLFHPDTDAAVVADAERRMLKTTREAAVSTLSSLTGYEVHDSVRKLGVPLRAINGDLFPTNVEAARKVKADFDAIVMKHVGHYPMLERPDEFNRHVTAVVEALENSPTSPARSSRP
jgi:pimeloyl-ACP methyl ester carboxylesterase